MGPAAIKRQVEQDRREVIARSNRLLSDAAELRRKALELQIHAAELIAQFKRDHPDSD